MSDLKEFEDFLSAEERLDLAMRLYNTWMSVYANSGLFEHYRAMTKAKAVLEQCKVEAYVPERSFNELEDAA